MSAAGTAPALHGDVPVVGQGPVAAPDIMTRCGQRTAQSRSVHLLVFTSLYPNSMQPRHGIFVEERLRKLVASGRVSAEVVAPVPWFPFTSARFGEYAKRARVPSHEERFGIHVKHPRYPVIPKFGMNIAPALMYHALLPVMRKRLTHGDDFDLIDAHYFYPDGVAAARLGAALGKPVVVTARGNDLTLLPNYRVPRRQIQRAALGAAGIATVSRALRDQAVALGVDKDKVTVLRNGVDLERFRPIESSALRARFGLMGTVWLAVGHLIERKGVHIAIGALAQAPGVTLVLAGDGPEEPRLRQLAERTGVAERVRFVGAVQHDELRGYYNMADTLILASSREGMPNVALEALACGTPVIAAPFAGADEVVSAPEAGEIAAARSAAAIAAAWQRLQARMPQRADTRRFAEAHLDWDTVVAAQCALYENVLKRRVDQVRAGEPA